MTGGSRGIGAAVIAELKRLDVEVIAPTRGDVDLSDLVQVDTFAKEMSRESLDILILNAGENIPMDLDQLSTDHWCRTMDVNLNSAFILVRELGPRMVEKRRGWITAISSCYSVRARAGRAPYSASKAALNALTRSAALEFAKGSVLVNAVAPGFVLTDLTRQNNDDDGIRRLEEQIPLGRLAEPSEIADLVAYLSGPTNTYITGQVFAVDGGFLCQ